MQLCEQRTQNQGNIGFFDSFLSSNAQNFLLIDDDSVGNSFQLGSDLKIVIRSGMAVQ
jgi:hypothetical protein